MYDKNYRTERGYIRIDYKERDIAYLAGIIDGEGTMYIGNFSKNPKTGLPNYQTQMEVVNTEKKLIEWLAQTFGGKCANRTREQIPGKSRKEVFIWRCSGDRLTHLCEILKPYLIIKRRQVDIMLEMRATYDRQSYQKGKQGTQQLPIEVLHLRQKLMDEMRALHNRTYSHKLHGHLPRVAMPREEV